MEENKKVRSQAYIVENKIVYHYNNDTSKYYLKLLNYDREIQVSYDEWNKIKTGEPYEQVR